MKTQVSGVSFLFMGCWSGRPLGNSGHQHCPPPELNRTGSGDSITEDAACLMHGRSWLSRIVPEGSVHTLGENGRLQSHSAVELLCN